MESPEKRTKKTAIIMVTYNGWTMTRNCLNDLAPLMEGDFVVAIADNNSSDGTVENIRKEFPKVHVYPQRKNGGFGFANNQAVRGLVEDGVEFNRICLLNNDTRIEPGQLENLQAAYDLAQKQFCGRESKAIVVPWVKNVDGTDQHNYFAGLGFEGIGGWDFFMNAFRSESKANQILEGKPHYVMERSMSGISFAEVHWASAVCWMLSRKVWEDLGGFDEDIFMYYEDADLALRARKIGCRFFIAKNSHITHLGGGSANNSLSRAQQHDASQEYVFKKHFGKDGENLSRRFRFARSFVRVVASLPFVLVKKSARQKCHIHWNLLKGVFQ